MSCPKDLRAFAPAALRLTPTPFRWDRSTRKALGRARGESFSISDLTDFTQRRGYSPSGAHLRSARSRLAVRHSRTAFATVQKGEDGRLAQIGSSIQNVCIKH